jgi:predicted enzyme related to lactoylglutathione lyase
MANPVAWFEVAGKDHQALKSFYSQLFDWEFTDMEEMPYSTVEAQNGSIPGGVGMAPEGHSGHVTFYVQVPEIEAALAKAESLGGKSSMGPIDLPGGGRIALFTDPEGHEIGLLTQPQS